MRVFLFGYYGYGNFGDEVLLSNAVELLNELKRDEKMEISILLPRRCKVPTNHRKVNRFNIIEVVLNILRSDVVIGGGGGIFQDETSFRSFLYYSSIVFISLIFRKKVILLCHGIGPLKREISRWMMRKMLSSDLLFPILRDEVSYRYSRMISKNSTLGVDLMILKPPKILKNPCRRKDKVSMVLRSIPKNLDEIAKFLKSMDVEEIDLLIFSPNEDYDLNRRIERLFERKFVINLFMDHNDLVESMMTSRFIVTERLHGAIFATLVGTPFISNSRIKKINRVFRDYPGRCDFNDTFEFLETVVEMEKFDFDGYRKRKLRRWEELRGEVLRRLDEILIGNREG